jgi:hypothetical protein
MQIGSMIDRLDYHRKQRDDALSLVNGETSDTELEAVLTELAALREKIKKGEIDIRDIQSRQYRHHLALQKLYNDVLQIVLSKDYSGHVTYPPKNDLEFQIRETAAGLTGEAVETLALVLADVTAMLWSVGGNGHHPCFLMHDSPREADLDGHVYNRYLRGIHDISSSLDGENAPFQYIVTSTSKPPKKLLEDKTVKERLQAHPESELLFRQFLGRPGELFPKAKEDGKSIDDKS